MITQFQLTNWKSFRDATLYVDQLTFLIGTNASGKSNILDALGLLRDLAGGGQIRDIITKVRGGEEWLIRRGCNSFTLCVTVVEGDYSFKYSIEIGYMDHSISILNERLERKFKKLAWKTLFNTDSEASANRLILLTRFYTGKQGRTRLDLSRQTAVLSQVEFNRVVKEVKDAARVVIESLKRVFILNPVPEAMRSYTSLSPSLANDASNIAGVLAAKSKDEQKRIEDLLSQYVKPLPERDINRVWAQKVGLYEKDAMLYCEEQWTPHKSMTFDARGMSDGTLRFISIVTALLTVEEKSLLVIEEIDNGLHPSRAKELVGVLKELGSKRQIDVLCTTHNPVLIDELGASMIPFISYVDRDEEGNSAIRLLEDIPNLAKLMSSNSVGGLMIKDRI